MRLIPYWLLFFLCTYSLAVPPSANGVIDLRDADFSQPISLDGLYQFYPNQLIYPGQFADTSDTYFPFPALWNGKSVNGHPLSAFGFATYRVHLLMPKSADHYEIFVEDVYSSFAVYWNGSLIARNGVVAESREGYVPYWKPLFSPLDNVRDTNELVLQIANFDHSKGGALEGMKLGTRAVMEHERLQIESYDLLLTGSLVMGGLFFLGLFLFGRHDLSIFYFSVFCIVYSYRIIGFGYYLLHSLLHMSWYLSLRLEYMTLFLPVFIFGRFVYHLYPQEAPKYVWDIISVISLSFLAITLITPPVVYTRLVEPFFVVLILYLCLTFVIYVRAFLHKRPGANFALLGTGVVFAVFLYNILVYFGYAPLLRSMSFWGYVLFFFSQSLVLSFRFAYFLKKARDEAEKAAQAKTDFLSTISHEIRTPLNAVVGLSHFLMQDRPRPYQMESLQSLRYSAEHLTSLINDILDYNKLESGLVTFEELDTNLQDTLQSIKKGYENKAQEKGLLLRLQFDETITCAVRVDRMRLSQIINNLLDNAIKFTREGEIVVRVKKQWETTQDISILYEIEDTGIGIPEDKLEIIFERFRQASSSTTREFGGTGLGLSIIKRLLELQGSGIRVKSAVGVGSVFYFEQTYQKGNLQMTRMPAVNEMRDEDHLLAGKKVLLVEDNSMNIMVMEKFMGTWRMQMEVAKNGREAVEKAALSTYDVILMDLQMPEMDGYEAAREIRSARNPVPILALTASALLRVKEKVLAAGMNDYITKPFDPKELKSKLIKYIHQ